MTRQPNVTIWDGVTEAPDETARGDWMKLVANAGLQWDKAILDYLVAGPPRGRAQGRAVLERRHPVDEPAEAAQAGEDRRGEEDDGRGTVEGGCQEGGKAGWAGHEVVQAFRPAPACLRWSLRSGMSAKSDDLASTRRHRVRCRMRRSPNGFSTARAVDVETCRGGSPAAFRRDDDGRRFASPTESKPARGRRPPRSGWVFVSRLHRASRVLGRARLR